MKTRFAILTLSLLLAAAESLCADAPRTAFPGSLAPVPPSAHDLTAGQPVPDQEPIRFQIALRLQPDGKAPETAYASLVKWLRGLGLTVTESAPPLHSMVQVSGTVAQAGKALATRFGRLEIGGKSYVAALSVPSLPVALSDAVIGINGLQPFTHLNKEPVFPKPVGARAGRLPSWGRCLAAVLIYPAPLMGWICLHPEPLAA